MSLKDVSYIHQYRETCPEMTKRAKKQDIIASRVIVKGLIGFGWTWDGILSSRTPLLDSIARHLSSHGYSLQRIRQECTSGQSVDVQSFSVPIPRPQAMIRAKPANARKRTACQSGMQGSKRKCTPNGHERNRTPHNRISKRRNRSIRTQKRRL
jgi:hypothetical protein